MERQHAVPGEGCRPCLQIAFPVSSYESVTSQHESLTFATSANPNFLPEAQGNTMRLAGRISWYEAGEAAIQSVASS